MLTPFCCNIGNSVLNQTAPALGLFKNTLTVLPSGIPFAHVADNLCHIGSACDQGMFLLSIKFCKFLPARVCPSV